ncbi:MAG: hypothetical protein IME99_05240 [Proteobacteria bacterium]|nr:hypothetical protein [Pseudomonadota bacterium]
MEHLVGKGVDTVMRALHARRFRAWETEAAPLLLKEELKRFTLLASALTGTPMRVVDLKGDATPRPYLSILRKTAHPALLVDHAFAWCDSETIYLPVSLVAMQTTTAQVTLAKFIIFYLSAQKSHGTLKSAFENRALLGTDNLVADLFWIIENRRLTSILAAEYPGLFKDWSETATYLLAQRPRTQVLREAEQLAEAFLSAALSDAHGSGVFAHATDSADASLEEAESIAAAWTENGVKTKRYRGMIPFAPWGRLLVDRLTESAATGGTDIPEQSTESSSADGSPEEENEKPSTDEKERSRYLTKTEEVDEEANEQGLLLNIYDKVLSWAEFVNVTRPFDDTPDEEQSKNADDMAELTTSELERTANTLFDAELEKAEPRGSDSSIDEPETAEVHIYPEWNYKKKCYRESYSKVTEVTAEEVSDNFVEDVLESRRGIIKEVRRKFEMLNPETRKTTRQTEGEEIDIDAVVEAEADISAGRQPDDRFYISEHRTERDLAVLFLVDLSMSTDAWISDRRVIDHEKEALVVLSEAMERLEDRYAVCGFSGKGRKGCRFYRIKSFKEEYGSTEVKQRIGGLIPHQYTRMGPAIRRATEVLSNEKSKMKLLFILSDGKPNDIDEYEGRYGVEDTRMAIKEAEGLNIVPFCLTIDLAGRDYLQRIFGKKNHAILPSVESLTRKLPELYARIVHSL